MLDPETRKLYCNAMAVVRQAGIPFMVGGAYGLRVYAGIARHTKDFDIFVMPSDAPRVLAAFEAAGHRTEMRFPHWLAKVWMTDDVFIDVIFSSGNGVATVDPEWFEHAEKMDVLGVPALVVPPEEMIWSKGYIMERERYDGADVAHLIKATLHRLDWNRLLMRFGPHWRVLLANLIMFGFIYPGDRHRIPPRVMEDLIRRLKVEAERPTENDNACRGPLLSREQYLMDTQNGAADPRLDYMSPSDIGLWTDAIREHEQP
jgi:hypothetical protein